jgi:hypothetical protein
MVETRSWAALAERLTTDDQLVDFAFPGEYLSYSRLHRLIEDIEKEYFDSVKIDRDGFLVGHVCRENLPDDLWCYDSDSDSDDDEPIS